MNILLAIRQALNDALSSFFLSYVQRLIYQNAAELTQAKSNPS